MDRSVLLLMELLLNESTSATISEKFSIRSNSLIVILYICTRPRHRFNLTNSISAKQAPTNYYSFSIFFQPESKVFWSSGRGSSLDAAKFGSRAFWFLKTIVRAVTPSDPMYFIRVGNRGKILNLRR